MDGWVSLHRRFMEWEWYHDNNCVKLFIHCLLKANHTEKKWKGKTIPRGSFLTGRKQLSYETGLSEQEVRTSLKRLKSTNELTSKSTNINTLITVTNYEKYQTANQQSNQQLTNEQPATNQQLTTTNNDNNDNKGNNENKINAEDFKSFINLFNKISDRDFKGDAKSKRQFTARLKDGYTLNDFEVAIKNLYKEPYHKENNFKNATPEFITRSDKLEMYRNKLPIKVNGSNQIPVSEDNYNNRYK